MAPDSGVADLGRYRLGRLLGRGGMGEVYLAHDQQLDRDVAIKFVAGSIPEQAARRVLREARAAAVLDHPCICTVYETGQTADGRPFIVMQYAEGEPLADALARGPLPVDQALSLCASIARALGVAHRRGLVHRDLKPSNVVITPDGSPRLLDFGIARRVVQPEGAADQATMESGVTAVGTIVGTPAYMSPEQIQQRPIDGRSDLFSLGAVLYESLTGRRAFEGPSPFETLSNVLHVEPPAPSSFRAGLDDRHDEVCRRLMAKDPANRYASAAEAADAIAAIAAPAPVTPAPGFFTRGRIMIATIALVAAVAAALWNRTPPLPPVPPEAQRWYDRGVDAMREGSYETARRALEQAVQIYPEYVLAYARLADAYSELDDERSAQQQLLRVSELLPDESRLPETEGLRLQAVRAAVLRDVDRAVQLQRAVLEREPDAGSWLDLGRIQESGGLRADARHAYAQAVARDAQSAAAYLRLGSVEAQEARLVEALAAFDKAETLYRAASDVEGQTEVCLQRGVVRDGAGDYRAARADLERALTMAGSTGSRHQQIRARLGLSRVTASEGQFGDAEKAAAAAVSEALELGLQTVAADGLVDLGLSLQQLGKPAEAEAHIKRAVQVSEQLGARRTAARARLQLASAYESQGKAAEALTIVQSVLPFLQANSYRQWEVDALQIATRAHQMRGEIDRARQTATDVLKTAERVKDELNVALALTNLASIDTTIGEYPAALRSRVRAEAIHRRLGDEASLPYDLVNRADLLVRLGRTREAEVLLSELEAGARRGLDGYVGRSARVVYLRSFAAITRLDCREALRTLATIAWSPHATDNASVLAPLLANYCGIRAGTVRASRTHLREVNPTLVGEQAFWIALTALEASDSEFALVSVDQALERLPSKQFDELRWRLNAAAAVAAERLGDEGRRTRLAADASQSLERLRAGWAADFDSYRSRPDIVQLMLSSGLR